MLRHRLPFGEPRQCPTRLEVFLRAVNSAIGELERHRHAPCQEQKRLPQGFGTLLRLLAPLQRSYVLDNHYILVFGPTVESALQAACELCGAEALNLVPFRSQRRVSKQRTAGRAANPVPETESQIAAGTLRDSTHTKMK